MKSIRNQIENQMIPVSTMVGCWKRKTLQSSIFAKVVPQKDYHGPNYLQVIVLK